MNRLGEALIKLSFALVIFFLSAPVEGRAGSKPIVTSDLLKIRTATDIDVSPDGRRAVFVVTEMGQNEKKEYIYFQRLWLVDLTGEARPRPLTHGERNDQAPLWSPDGTRLAFVRAKEGKEEKPQIWILPLDGGEAYVLTDAPHGASGPRWSPDGTRILYSSELPLHAIEGELPWPYERAGRGWRDEPNWKAIKEKEKQAGQQANEPGAGQDKEKPKTDSRPDGNLTSIRAWLAENASEGNPRVFDRLNLQGEQNLQPEPSFDHLFVVEARPGVRAVQITQGFQNFNSAEWSPDGAQVVCSSVAYTEHPDRVTDSDVWLVASDGSEKKLLLDWPSWLVFQPRYSPDGRWIAFVANDQRNPTYGVSRLGVVPAGGGSPRWLTAELDREVVSPPVWSADSRNLYFIASTEGSFPLLRVPAAGGKTETLVGGPRGIRDFDLKGERLVYAATEVKNPYELYAASPSGAGERRLTALNQEWLAEKGIAQPTEHWLERPDGRRVQYWVMEPAGRRPGQKYPLVLEIHGGPSAMWGPGEFTMWHEFQLLASWGYGIVYSNPRGSGGYGHEFRKANYRNWGHGPAGDILAALDQAARLEWVDREQLFVTGGSYAGYMTAWIVSQDHRFKAAVAQRGVYDIGFFFGEGLAWRLVPYHFGGYPWEPETRKFLQENSPLSFVTNIRTPLLIIHSDRDLRTGVSQSETLYKSLKVLGRPVEYVRYPEEGHELSRSGNPKRRMDRLNRIVEFFERYARHPEPPPATEPE